MKRQSRFLTFAALAALGWTSAIAGPVDGTESTVGQSQATRSDRAEDPGQDNASPSTDSNEIIVTGERPLDPDFKLDRAATVTSVSRTLAAEAYQFVRCTKLPSNRLLRAAIDDPPNSPTNWWALDRIIRTHQGCYSGIPIVPPIPQSP